MSNDWRKFQAEIEKRVRKLQAADPLLGYQDAFNAVLRADPKLTSNRWDAVQVEISGRVKGMMATHPQLDYRRALIAVLVEDSNLAREYREARSANLSTTGGEVDDSLGVELGTLVQEKVAASEGMDHVGALRMVLAQRPDLARRYKATMGGPGSI